MGLVVSLTRTFQSIILAITQKPPSVPEDEDICKSKYLQRQRLMVSDHGDSDKQVKG